APPPDPPHAPPAHHNPWDDGLTPAQLPRPGPAPDPYSITVDVRAWPQIRAHVANGIPLTLAIQALELTLAQLRQLYIQSEVQRMRI
ncbi:MAG TPA: hypothetical protein VM366_16495, partial [Anaerolineae bacterium]|nr:hypothetical protein [Anaerolineae bacterium]